MVIKQERGILVKSNYLIETSQKLTITEQKILYLILTKIDKNDIEFKDYEFPVSEFINKLDLKGKSAYIQLKAATKLLRSRTFTIICDGKEIQTGWVSEAEYNNKKGTVTFTLSKRLKPFLLQVKSYFTVFELDNLIQLKSIYSTRIYELLKQYKKIGERTFDLIELKKLLAIDNKGYELYTNFKQKVILVAQKELNEKTDISFEFCEIKESRKVVAIKFIINSNNPESYREELAVGLIDKNNELVIDSDYNIQDLIKLVRNFIVEPLTDNSIKNLLKASSNNLEIIKEKYLLLKESTSQIDDIGAWLHTAIRNDYKKIKRLRVSKFNNFKGRYAGKTTQEIKDYLKNIEPAPAEESEDSIKFKEAALAEYKDK